VAPDRCPDCGTALRPGAKACLKCGRSVVAAPRGPDIFASECAGPDAGQRAAGDGPAGRARADRPDIFASSWTPAAPGSQPEPAAPTARLVPRADRDAPRGGFPIVGRAVVGRHDPAMEPVDIDLGGLPDGRSVSRRHAGIWWEPIAGWRVLDLGSARGTCVRPKGCREFVRVSRATPIVDGDEIALGRCVFLFRADGAAVPAGM